jgi:hypothetical protein
VHDGRFAPVDDAMAKAVRMLFRDNPRIAKGREPGIDWRHAGSSPRAGRDRGRRDEAATGRTLTSKFGAGKRLALRVLSGKKEFIVTRNDIAGLVH